MATKYLLPCACGNSIAIESSQAGQMVSCSCGQQVEAPSLRTIRGLESQADTTATKQRRNWGPAAGTVFVLGSALVLVGLTTCGFAYFSRSLLKGNLPVRSQEGIDQWLGEIDSSESHALIDIWNNAVEVGFEEAEDSPWHLYRNESRKYDIAIWIGFAACSLGLGCTLAATMLRAPAA